MSRVTPAVSSVLNSMPQKSNFFLFVQNGDFIWTGVVTAVTPITTGVAQGGYRVTTTTLSGDKHLVRPNMTVWIGATGYPKSKGRCRVIIAEDSGINFMKVNPNGNLVAVGDILSVDRILRLEAINDFHDVGVTPPANYWPPYACPGPNRHAWTNEPITFWSLDSWAQHGKTIANYSWDFGSPSSIVTNPPGLPTPTLPQQIITVQWSAPGDYVITHTVTDSAGQQHAALRLVMVRNRPIPGADNIPYERFQVDGLNQDYDNGGWTGNIRVLGAADTSTFPDMGAVILVSSDYYGPDSTAYAFGGYQLAPQIIFSGNIRGATARNEGDLVDASVTFQVSTWQEFAKELVIWPADFETTASPDPWHNYAVGNLGWTNLDILYHVLVFHSTASSLMDLRNYNMYRRVDYLYLTEDTLYNQLSDQIGANRLAKPVWSRLNQLYMQPDANTRTGERRAAFGSVEHTFDKSWWTSIDLGEERLLDQVGQIEFDGVYINTTLPPAKDNIADRQAFYPSQIHSYGKVDKIQGVQVNGQDEANLMAEIMFLKANIRFPLVTVSTWNLRGWDAAEQPYVGVTLDLADTLQGWLWESKEFIVRHVEYEINTDDGYLRATYGLEDSIWGSDGLAGRFPGGAIPPDYQPGTLPPVDERTGQDMLACWKYGVLYCADVFAANPNWEDRTGNLASLLGRNTNTAPRINGVYRDVFDPTNTWWAWGHFGIAYTLNGGLGWAVVYNANTMQFYMPALTPEQVSTFSVLRHQQSAQPDNTYFALVATKMPGSALYSQVTLIHTHNDWNTVHTHLPVQNGVRFTDPGQYSAANLAQLAVHQWPGRQSEGKHVLWIASNQANYDTVQLWRSINGGHSLDNLIWGAGSGYQGRWPSRVVIPYINNDDCQTVYWCSDGSKDGNSLYRLDNADEALITGTNMSTNGALFGVGIDDPLAIDPRFGTTFQSAGNGPNPSYKRSLDTGATWFARSAPRAPYLGFAAWQFNTLIAYVGTNGPFSVNKGMFYTTQNGGASWEDRSGNLYQLMTIAGSNANAGGVWSLAPNWDI